MGTDTQNRPLAYPFAKFTPFFLILLVDKNSAINQRTKLKVLCEKKRLLAKKMQKDFAKSAKNISRT
jgi:hypothetical protein